MATGSIDGVSVDIVDGEVSRRVRRREIFERAGMDGHGDRDLGLTGTIAQVRCTHWTTDPGGFLDSLLSKVGNRPATITLSRGDSDSSQHILAIQPGTVRRVEKNGSLTYQVTAMVTLRHL